MPGIMSEGSDVSALTPGVQHRQVKPMRCTPRRLGSAAIVSKRLERAALEQEVVDNGLVFW